MKVYVLEVFCLLSARGYILGRPGYPMAGGVSFLASKLMGTGGGTANVHLDLPDDLSDVRAFPETSMGSAGMKESGDVCALIGNVRARARR